MCISTRHAIFNFVHYNVNITTKILHPLMVKNTLLAYQYLDLCSLKLPRNKILHVLSRNLTYGTIILKMVLKYHKTLLKNCVKTMN